MSHIVFVTTELSPWVPGGAGSVVAGVRHRLQASGDRVTVLLVADLDADLPDDILVVGTAPGFEARSEIAAAALAALVAADAPDLIEFQDFDGLAFTSLTRRAEVGVEGTPIQVRLHAPADLIYEAIGAEPPWIDVVRSMERSTFRMADRVVVPSPAFGPLLEDRYGLEPERILVGQPPSPEPRRLDLFPSTTPLIVSLGRLGEQKGTHDLVVAAVAVLRDHPDLRLVLIGEDGWSVEAELPMQEWLKTELIPADVAGRIEFTGRLEGEALDRRLAGAWAAVFPSRFETFSLAAHEARAAGLPIIVSDLPAFAGLLDESTGALVYDGTRHGLTAALEMIIDDADLRHRLAAAPSPGYDDPLAPYSTSVAVRHPRSQAGLATAAVQQLERDRPPVESGTAGGWGQRAMQWLPGPVARAAVVVLPQSLKDRFRSVADWRVEEERRAQEARQDALRSRIAAGAYPTLPSPRVTVVIPCFNQGSFLDGAIRSVLEQTMESFEIIVVDDGSTDPETIAVIDDLDWPRTRVIRQDNRGLSAARNAGIGEARGELVVPLDADDELTPQFLERLVAALDADLGAGFACCWARLFGDIDAVWVPRRYNPYQLLLSNSVVGCVVLRRAAWEAVGGYDETMTNGNEDWELWIRLMAAGWGVAEVDEPLFRYRKHGISMSVETESRFEAGRKEIVERHPELYTEEALDAARRQHYPLLSIIPGDVALAAAIVAGHSKYVAHWSGVEHADPETLDRLADLLESRPDLGAATTNDAEPLVLVRRWSLLDPDGPTTTEAADLAGSATEQLRPGMFPDPAWTVPNTIDGVPVQRQRPEEDGRVPSWAAT